MKIIQKKLHFSEINNIIDELEEIIKKNEDKSICLGLIGDLGTGKTTITKRLLKNLGIKEAVKSPTFTYLIEYEIDGINISHFDVYRISSEDDLYNIGFFDYIDSNGLVIVEWANLILDSMPKNTVFFEIEHDDIETRLLSIYKLNNGVKEYVDLPNYDFN